MKIEKKIWPEYFGKVLNGEKTYELRLADFKCQPGDVLILKEWDQKTKKFTGRVIEKKVGYIGRLKLGENKFWSKYEIKKHGYYIISLI